MKEKGRTSEMLIPSAIMGSIAFILLFVGYLKGENRHLIGLKFASNMMIKILPLLIFAFIIAGMIQVLIPKELLSKWIGIHS